MRRPGYLADAETPPPICNTARYDPVCGKDGKTYSNGCQLAAHNSQLTAAGAAGNVGVKHRGKCWSPEAIAAEESRARAAGCLDIWRRAFDTDFNFRPYNTCLVRDTPARAAWELRQRLPKLRQERGCTNLWRSYKMVSVISHGREAGTEAALSKYNSCMSKGCPAHRPIWEGIPNRANAGLRGRLEGRREIDTLYCEPFPGGAALIPRRKKTKPGDTRPASAEKQEARAGAAGCLELWKEMKRSETALSSIVRRDKSNQYKACIEAASPKGEKQYLLIGAAILAAILLLRKRSI